MDAFQQMRLHVDSLTPAERRVHDAIVANPEAILQSTTTMVAKEFGVSQSAVSRFCQKIGYGSFSDFRTSLTLSLSRSSVDEQESGKKDPVDYLCAMVRDTKKALPDDVLRSLATRVLSSPKIFTSGGGLSSPPAHMLSMELLKYNVPCFFVENGQEMIHLHVADRNDLVILFSSKNDTQRMFLNVLQDTPKSRRPHTVMVTHSSNHPLKKLVDELICLPTWQTERYPVYIEPMTSMIAFCSILMLEVSKESKCDPERLPPIVNGRVGA